MKDKVLAFIIGLLVGAIVTASGFIIYQKTNKRINQMPGRNFMQTMERPSGEIPPEMPSGTGNDTNRPKRPSKNNSSTNGNLNLEGEESEK